MSCSQCKTLMDRLNYWQANTRMADTSDYVVKMIRWDQTGHSMTCKFVDGTGKEYTVSPIANGMVAGGSCMWKPLQSQLRELLAIVDAQVAIGQE